MAEFPISEVATPERCLEIFRDCLKSVVNDLPLNDSEKPKLTFLKHNDVNSSSPARQLLEIVIEIGVEHEEKLENTYFGLKLRNLVLELNAKFIQTESHTTGDKVIQIKTLIEFFPFESTPFIRACDFEEDFKYYINGIYYSAHQAVIEQNRSTTTLSESSKETFLISGQVGLDSESELSEIVTFRDLDREKQAIVNDLSELASKYKAMLVVVDSPPSVICFEVVFEKPS